MFEHPSIVMADDLEPFERLKLHILNLRHRSCGGMASAPPQLRGDSAPNARRPRYISRLSTTYAEEVVPNFALHYMCDEAARYVQTAIERFENPF
jgi:tagaturonate reductase